MSASKWMSSKDELSEAERWRLRYEREKAARREAERMLEESSRALYLTNQRLAQEATVLERQVEARSAELRESLRRTQDAMQRAEAAARVKGDFLAVMSHEVRTPLHGVLGMAELMALTTLNGEQRDLLDMLHHSAHSLQQLLNDILDLQRLDAGQLILEQLPVELCGQLERVAGQYQPQAEAKGLGWSLQLPAQPVWLQGDAARLRQIVGHLLSNAVRFTEQGGIELKAEAAPLPGGRLQLAVHVRDSGPGIAAELLARLFRPFELGDATLTRRHGGCGLGLVVSQRLAHAMDGDLQVATEPGKGSAFTLTWQALRSAEPTRRNVAGLQEVQGHNLRVLVVEDNEVNRRLTEMLLRRHGYDSVQLAENGQQALAMMETAGYDLVLMDVSMPIMDGIEATRRIRAMALPSQPCIVALTANADDENRHRCGLAGMDDFLVKPVDLQALKQVIDQALSRSLLR